MSDNSLKILSPAKMGSLTISNRLIMAPLTRNRANNPELVPTKLHEEYYRQRASAGLIISEGTVVSPRATGYMHVPGIYNEAQTKAWEKVTIAVHKANGKIFSQLWHVGGISHPDFQKGQLPLAPSAINPQRETFTPKGIKNTVTPKALSISEIKQTANDFRQAAQNAMKAGFDGVEIHSSNGYLFHQFFNNSSNTRTDDYGGSIPNKTRFLFETIDAVSEVMPADRIGIRLNPMMHGRNGIMVDEETRKTFEYIIERLNQYNLAYLHLSRTLTVIKQPWFINDVIGHFRKIYRGFLIANSDYNRETGEEEIRNNRADAIAFGRLFISNPDLPERFKNDWPLEEPDETTFYEGGTKGYIDYPFHKNK